MAEQNTRTGRAKVLQQALDVVEGQRNEDYGSPLESFESIARLWRDYPRSRGVTVDVTPGDVAAMMTLVKISRLATGGSLGHYDSWLDIAGYAACGHEVTEAEREDT